MNKTEKLISLILGLGLVWCLFFASRPQPETAEQAEAKTSEAAAETNAVETAEVAAGAKA